MPPTHPRYHFSLTAQFLQQCDLSASPTRHRSHWTGSDPCLLGVNVWNNDSWAPVVTLVFHGLCLSFAISQLASVFQRQSRAAAGSKQDVGNKTPCLDQLGQGHHAASKCGQSPQQPLTAAALGDLESWFKWCFPESWAPTRLKWHSHSDWSQWWAHQWGYSFNWKIATLFIRNFR